jgi:Lon protease-like protein
VLSLFARPPAENSPFRSVEQGLVQDDSPFCGTRQFGMCFFSRDRLAGIGATLHIDEYVHMEDGRLVVTTKGIERFRIKSVIKERPVLVCEVLVCEEDDDRSSEVGSARCRSFFIIMQLVCCHVCV